MADSIYGPSEGLDPSKPVEGLSIYAPDPNAPGPFVRGLKTGVSDLKSIAGGVAQYVGRGLGAKPLETLGENIGANAAAESAPYRMQVEDVGTAFDQGVGPGLGATADLIKYTVGNQIPMLATAVVGGLAGRVAAGAMGATAAAAGVSAAEKAAAVAKVAAGTATTREAAIASAVKAADIGAELGLGASSVGMELGQIAPEGLKPGADSSMAKIATGALAAGALDTILPIYLARKMGLIGAAERALTPRPAGMGAIAGDVASTALKAGTFETAQESAQSVIERAAAGQPLTGPDATSDYLNSGVMGGIMGILTGGIAGGVHGLSRPVEGRSMPEVGTSVPNTEQAVAESATNVADLGTPAPASITPESIHADLTAQHAAATAQETDLTSLLGTLQQAQTEGEAKVAALAAEAKLDPGQRRIKSEILAEKKDMAAQVKEVKAKIEEVGGQLNAARTAIGTLAPQLEAARQGLPPAPIPEGTVPSLATPEITPRAAPLESSVIADPNTPAPTEAEHIDRAVKGVHAMFREQGMPLTTTAESLATPPTSAREVALAKVEQRTPRESVPQASPAQMAAVEANAMTVIEPLAKTMAETKTSTPEGQAKVAAKLTAVMRGVVQEAAKQGSIEAAQQYVTDTLPNALKGHGVTADATDMAKAVNAGVGLARTQFSKGATDIGDLSKRSASDLRGLEKQIGDMYVDGKMTDDEFRTRSDPVIAARVNAELRENRLGPAKGIADVFPGFKQIPVGTKVLATHGTRYAEPTMATVVGSRSLKSSLDGMITLHPKVDFGDGKPRTITTGGIHEVYTPRAVPSAPTSESRAALTQDTFDTLPVPAQFAAVDAYNRVMRAKGTALRQRMAQLIGNRPELKIMTFSATPDSPIGSYTRTGPLKAAISMALNAKEGLSVADHEGYHFAEDWLLSASEKKVVANAMKAGKPLYTQLVAKLQQYDRENGTSLTDEVTAIPAEARAYAFEFWRRGEFKADGALAKAWAKLKQFFERIVNAVNGMGFQSIEDVFTALDRGQMAEREMVAPENSTSRNSMGADYLQSPAFKKWFGDSKVVDKDGKPLVVYHSGMFDETQDAIPQINGEGFHFGTKTAAEMRDSGKQVDDFIKAAVIEKGEGTQGKPAWFWSSEGVDSFEAVGEDGYATRAEAETHMKLMATQWAGDEFSEPMPVTQAYLSLQNPKRVKDQGENWTAAVAKAKAEGYDGIVYRNEFEDKGKDSYIVFSPTQIKSVNNTGAFDPNNPDIRFSKAGSESLTGSRAWIDATKPQSVREQVQHYLSGELAAVFPLEVVDAAVLPATENDQVRRAIIEAIPVDVVNILTKNSITPESLLRKPDVIGKRIPINDRPAIAGGLASALQLVGARLRTALNRVLSAETGRRDEEVLPAVRASQIDPRVIVGLLSPISIYGVDGGQPNAGVGSTLAGTEATVGSSALTGVGRELSPAKLALLLNRHNELLHGRTGDSIVKFRPPADISATTGLSLFSRAAVEQQTRMANGELEMTQLFDQGNRMIDAAMLHKNDALKRLALGAVADDITGSISRWWMKNISTPNYVASFSNGYKNVMHTLNTYIRYRETLIEKLLREQMPEWYRADFKDQDAASNALLARTLGKWDINSEEYKAMYRDLTPAQRTLFDGATRMINGFLDAELAVDAQDYKRHLTTAGVYEKWIADRTADVQRLKQEGYVPLRRYGDHTVRVFKTITDKTGNQQQLEVRMEAFQHQAEADIAAGLYKAEFERQGAPYTVEAGIKHKTARDTTVSVQQYLDTARRNGVEISQTERERLVLALTAADSMVRNRMMRRSGMPGFSKDGMRILNEFGVNMSGKLAYSKFASAIDAAAEGRKVEADVVNGEPVINIDHPVTDAEGNTESAAAYEARNIWTQDGPKSGFYQNMADQLSDYVLVPDHTGTWSRKLRGAAMTYFIGGSISGAMVNTMSVPMLLVPQLSVHTNYLNSMTQSMSAWKTTWQHQAILRDITRLRNLEQDPKNAMPEIDKVPGLRAALIAATDKLHDTELHQIMSISQGQFFSQSRRVQKAMDVWMSPFRVSEQTNRITSFIAAYNVGRETGLKDQALFNFARDMVDSTQNNYSAANRPGAARNPVFALAFMFKSYPLFMVEAAHLMYKANPKAAVFMLLGLTALTGVEGLPFAETILDLVDTISQRLFGSAFNTRRAMRNAIKSASEAFTGYDASNLVMRGMLNELAGISASSRIGAGDFVPGSRLGTADADQGKILSQFVGAPYAMLKDVSSNIGKLVGGVTGGDWKQAADALRAGGPIAVRNAIKGLEQLDSGYASDSKGRKITDVSTLDGMLQMTGLSSAAVAKMYDMENIIIQTKAFYTQVSQDMQAHLVEAYRDGDQDRIRKIVDLRNKWNEQNPTMPIMPSVMATRRAIIMAGVPLDRREQMMLGRRMAGAYADVTEQMAK